MHAFEAETMFANALGMCETNSKLAQDFFKGVPAARKLTSALVADLLRPYPPPPIVAAKVSRRHSADVAIAVAGHVLVTKPLRTTYTSEHAGRGPKVSKEENGFRPNQTPSPVINRAR